MKHTIGYALIVFAAMTSTSVASSGTNPTSSGIDRVLQGHGSAGETAKSASNPDISYQVLDNGEIQKTNSAYDRVDVVRPSWWQGMSTRQRDGWAGQ